MCDAYVSQQHSYPDAQKSNLPVSEGALINSLLLLALQLLTPSYLVQASPACEPIRGIEAVASNEALRWLVIGEQHGTTETPAAFADLVCNIAQLRRRAVVAVEYPESAQPFIDAYLDSDGGRSAQSALLEASVWHSDVQDGRWSEAFLNLFEKLRVLHKRGAIERVVAIQPAYVSPQSEYERAMAARVEASSATPQTLSIVLVGNVHAMIRSQGQGGEPFTPMAGFLPFDRTITLNAVGNGGALWSCHLKDPGAAEREIVCAAKDFGPARQQHSRGIVIESATDSTAFSGSLFLGSKTTASPPAIGVKSDE